MDFSIKPLDAKTTFSSALTTLKTACLVVGIFEDRGFSKEAQALDAHGAISAALKSGDLSCKAGSTLLLHRNEGLNAERILLVGLGKELKQSTTQNTAAIQTAQTVQTTFSEKDFTSAMHAIARALSNLGANEATLALPFDRVQQRDAAWAVRVAVLALRDSIYRFDCMKSKQEAAPTSIKKVFFALPAAAAAVAKSAVAEATALCNGIALTKDLANLPPNICTPTYLADTAKKLAKDYALDVQVLDRKQMEALKMGSFLSVAKGSDEPPKFIILKHLAGKAKEAPVVLVGKGITFDSGGISIKPGANMDEMKYDMCGAASVLGTLRAVAEMKLKINVIGLIPACENMPSGGANRPGDIVTSMSGQTIEILNTDAEGRLILCDALTYAERFKPAAVIDIATLTGACVVALGHHNSGLFTRYDAAHDALAAELLAAGKAAGDPAWRMPLDDAYQEQLKSNFADMANIGGLPAGSVTAACFLERYTKKYTWAHLDVAGTAWKSGAAKGATGRPVPLLTMFLMNRVR